MQLSQALRINHSEIVAFVGGGGKTTAMFRLAGEIVQAGGRVITTTTTRIFAAQTGLAPNHFILQSPADLAPIRAALTEGQPHVLVTGPVDSALGKAFGVDAALIAQLAQLPQVAAVLIEADGSRMRPFKAPAEHEPVIPVQATLVVPVVGADVFGARLDDVRVHRPELVSALAAVPEGSLITPEIVARVLAHPQGGLKNAPPQARVIPLINKVETANEWAAARATAALLLETSAIERVVIGAVREADPAREVQGRVAAVVLAAGRSTRMGTPKQILPWGAGGTLVGEVTRRLQASGVSDIVVVTGAARTEVEAALANEPVRFVFNPDYATSEMARSLQVGLRALPENCSVVLVALADQPQIEPDVVRAVIQRWRETQAPVVAPAFHGQRGNPLLLDRALWPELLGLPADANPRAALRAAQHIELVPVATDSILHDIDTPADYEAARSVRV